MILKSARNNLRGACGHAVNQNDDGIFIAIIAASGIVALFLRMPSRVVNNQLALFQEMVADLNGLLKQSAGIAAKVKNEALQILFAQFVQRVAEFVVGILIELVDVDVGDAGPNEEGIIHAVLGNLVARNLESRGAGRSLHGGS